MSPVKQMRTERGIPQAVLAKVIGSSLGNYSKKENGQTRFSLDEAKALADYFGVAIETLFYQENDSKLESI